MYTCTTGTGAGETIYRVPVYSPFLRVDTIINGQVIESVSQYKQVCQMSVNCNTEIAGGVQYAYGYLGATITLNAAVANNIFNFVGPNAAMVVLGKEEGW